MRNAIKAVLHHSVVMPDVKERHQYCPDGPESWCKYKRTGENPMEKYHLDPPLLAFLTPTFNNLATDNLLKRCHQVIPRTVMRVSMAWFGYGHPNTSGTAFSSFLRRFPYVSKTIQITSLDVFQKYSKSSYCMMEYLQSTRLQSYSMME